MKTLQNLWNDEGGFTVALELVLVAVILVIGIVTGLSAVRNATLEELEELGDAILAINDSYSFSGSRELVGDGRPCASTGCTSFVDVPGNATVILCTCGT